MKLRPFKSALLRASPAPLRRAYHDWANRLEFDLSRYPVERLPAGVNIIGYLRSESGIGESARALAQAARAAQIPFALLGVAGGHLARAQDHSAGALHDANPYDVNLFCVNAFEMKSIRENLGGSFFANRHSVGYWYWEVPPLPEDYGNRFDGLSEIWTASRFVAQIIEQAVPKERAVRVRVVAPPVESRFSRLSRSDLGLPDGAFLFLAMADAGSFLERKNPEGAIAAFVQAFRSTGDALLVVKINHPERDPPGVARLYDAARGANVQIVDRTESRAQIDGYLSVCDAFVSLHRAEGFGLPCAEAMALGKPVVATDYSGTADFVTEETAFPVRASLTRLAHDVGPYEAGGTWAEPDLDDAVRQMRRVREDSAEARRRANAGAAFMASQYDLQSRGRALSDALDAARQE